MSITSCCYCAIGNTSLPLNKVVSWSTCTPSGYGNAGNFYSGVAPFDVNQNEKNNYYKCWWYINCCDYTLISGPPHEYRNKKYAQIKEKYVKSSYIVGVVIDTISGDISFIVDGVNLGVAYKGIPLDKPLCALCYH